MSCALCTGTHRWTSPRPRSRWGGGTHALGLRAPAGRTVPGTRRAYFG